MRKRLVGIVILASALVLLLALAPACGGGENGEQTPVPGTTPTPKITPTATSQVKTLKMGVLTPLSGPAAPWGTQILWGIQWAVDKYNETGFKVGNDIYTIKLVTGDDKFVGSTAAAEITRMISDEGIHYVIGPIGTWQAIDPIALQGKCFVISSSPEASYIGTNPYSFIAAAPVATWHRTFWGQAYADPDLAGVKTVAVLTPDPNLYDSFVDAETAVQESHGRQVVIVKRYTQFTQDYYPILTPVLAKNPDVVSFCGGNIGDEDLMLKQLRELGFKGIIAGPAHGNPASAAAVAGCAYTEGYRNNDPDYSSTIYPESVRALHAEFQTLHPGQALALTTCIGFYGVQLYVDAMKKAGTTDTDAVMKVFDDPNFSFDHFGQTSTLGGLQTYGMNRIINDEVCYSKVINCENVMISRLAAVTP